MTAATVARSASDDPTPRVAHGATAAGPPSAGPRLLLPPVSDPAASASRAISPGGTPPVVRSVLSSVTETAWPLPAPSSPARRRDPLPDPTQLCGSLVLAVVEVLAGSRPLVQLTRWVSPPVLEALADRVPDTATAPPGTGAVADRPAGSRRGRTAVPVRRATIRRTRLSRVGPTVAEAGVVLHDGTRVRAAAVRLEVHRGHWRATALQIG